MDPAASDEVFERHSRVEAAAASDEVFERQPRVEAAAASTNTPEGTVLSDAKHAAETIDGRPVSVSVPGRLTFVRRRRRYRAEQGVKLRNSLLLGAGLLELANAGDFAANVWNQVPVPAHAVALMAAGASLALGIACVAARDALLSWRNLRGLAADCWLDVNRRETGSELVGRLGMDVTMGFGALVVAVGTYMAIAGADPAVFQASNLLSGYVGNAPCAAYGLVNLLWSAYVWRRARGHGLAGRRVLGAGRAGQMLRMRTSSAQFQGALSGITGVVAGAASLVTATMWWGYVVLAPCIVSSVLVNYLWRHRVGYDRPFVRRLVPFDADSLVAELAHVDACRQQLASGSASAAAPDPPPLARVLAFVSRNKLFEELCLRVLADAELAAALFGGLDETVTVDLADLAAVDRGQALTDRVLEIAQALIAEAAPKCFNDQECYLLEVLGCYLCRLGSDEGEKAQGTVDEGRKH